MGFGEIDVCLWYSSAMVLVHLILMNLYHVTWQITCAISAFAQLYSSTSANNSILAGVQYI